MPQDFPPGFALLLQWLDNSDYSTTPPEPPRDWTHFEHLLHRHRVTRRVVAAMRAAGVVVPDSLAQSAKAKTLAAMQQVAEADRLQSALQGAGMRSMILKGPPLSQTLYGDPTLRESKDIDVLVAREDFGRAVQVLGQTLGYSCATPPPLDRDRAQLWLDGNKDITLTTPSGVGVELHHRLTAVESLLPSLGLDQASESVTIGGTHFAQFDRESLFTYLSVHGAASRFHRLTWIADIRAMLAPATDAEVERYYAASAEHGVGRCALAAMVLCHRLWGQSLPASITRAAERDSRVAAIVANSLTTLIDDDYVPATARGRASVSNALLLRDDRGYRRAVIRHWMADPALLSAVSIPQRLRLLYVPLRLLQWTGRKLTRLWR